MISFRYHIVSIVSVFLALAVGIALGGGPLKGKIDNSLVKELADRKHELALTHQQVRLLQDSQAYADSFAAGAAKPLLANKLTGATVAIVTLPTGNHDLRATLGELVRLAGGKVSGTYDIAAKVGTVSNRQLIETLTSQLAAQSTGIVIPADASGYERLGILVSRAVGTPQATGAPYDTTAQSIISGLSTAGLMSADGTPTGRAGLMLIVSGPASTTAASKAANSIFGRVLDAMSGNVVGIAVTGPSDAARTGGMLKQVRSDANLNQKVTTVDSVETGAGQVVTLLALARRLQGSVGQYGAVDAQDGVMPGATATP
ncbi:MAG: copper transporter [Actinomycetota bacterium]|nr:copper transporter [Actinomycetota bacterium]